MGREKKHRQCLKYLVASAKKKTIENQMAAHLTIVLGMSETEARPLAHCMNQWVFSQPGICVPNQVLVEAAAGRNPFVYNWQRFTKNVGFTPFDPENLDLELSFGLATMQMGCILRMIDESHQ